MYLLNDISHNGSDLTTFSSRRGKGMPAIIESDIYAKCTVGKKEGREDSGKKLTEGTATVHVMLELGCGDQKLRIFRRPFRKGGKTEEI